MMKLTMLKLDRMDSGFRKVDEINGSIIGCYVLMHFDVHNQLLPDPGSPGNTVDRSQTQRSMGIMQNVHEIK